MIHFEWPWIFFLSPLPWLIYRFVPAQQRAQSMLYMPLLKQNNIITSKGSSNKPTLSAVIGLSLLWVLLLLSAAKPVKIGDIVELPNTGRDVLLAVDISGSMQLQDMTLNNREVDRLTLVKKVVSDFVEKRQGDRLGLILFGTNAYVQAPLTFDLTTVSQLLNEAQIGFAGDATAIGDAIGLSIKRLTNNPADSRVVILLTDGQNTAGAVSPIQAAQLAQQESVVIYTVGIGSDQIISSGFLGLNRYNPSQDLDEKTLTNIATITGGKYFRARNQDELNSIYDTIDQLEAIKQKAESVRPQQALFYWPLGIAMVISILFALLKTLTSQRNLL
jgi:Ca-activated chloride channel family protein